MHRSLLAVIVLAALSCTPARAPQSPAPESPAVPTPAAAAAPAAPAAAQAPTGQPNDPNSPLRPRRVPIPRDSLARLRQIYVDQVMKQIAGRENEPADQVFKNVKVLKGITALQLVKKMDKDYGEALSWNCSNCHRALSGNWATDSMRNKVRARAMQEMTNVINGDQLPKIYPTDTPQVSCVTCHRGYNEPLEDYLIPARGTPGGPPFPTRRPGPPPAQRPPR